MRARHLGAVECVSLDQLKFAADHLVEGANVADDLDPLDVNLRALLDIEGNVDGMLFPVPGDVRLDFDKGITAVAEGIRQHRNRFFDSFGIVPVAGVNSQKRQHRFGGQVLELDVDVDFAEAVPLAFVEGESNDEAVAVGCQFGNRRDHSEIGISLGQVKPAQQLSVVRQSIRVIGIVAAQETIPSAFLRLKDAAQLAVGILVVADEIDAAHPGEFALVDLEDEIDPVFRELDELRLDGCTKPAVPTI